MTEAEFDQALASEISRAQHIFDPAFLSAEARRLFDSAVEELPLGSIDDPIRAAVMLQGLAYGALVGISEALAALSPPERMESIERAVGLSKSALLAMLNIAEKPELPDAPTEKGKE